MPEVFHAGRPTRAHGNRRRGDRTLCVYIALVVSYHYDIAAGATMSGISVAVFFVVLATKELTTARRTVPPSR